MYEFMIHLEQHTHWVGVRIAAEAVAEMFND